jgi:hypothetical protein
VQGKDHVTRNVRTKYVAPDFAAAETCLTLLCVIQILHCSVMERVSAVADLAQLEPLLLATEHALQFVKNRCAKNLEHMLITLTLVASVWQTLQRVVLFVKKTVWIAPTICVMLTVYANILPDNVQVAISVVLPEIVIP